MHSLLRLSVAALTLMTIACFYYQLSDLPNIKNVLQHVSPEKVQVTVHPSHVDYSTSRTAPGFGGSQEEEQLEQPAPTYTEASSSSSSDAEPNDKAVVMGALSTDDVTWATTQLKGWDAFVYTVDNNASITLHTDHNKGKEANAYLSYIIQNYELLPSTVAFVHSHEFGWLKAWHTDAARHSNVESLNSLNTNFVQRNGYANLRCIPNPGCPDEVRPFREPVDESKTTEVAFAAAWRDIFGNDDVPEVIGVACCAQFAVSRDQILKRTRDEYIRMHQWLMNTELDDSTSGRVFEYLWHIIFGQESVYCPSVGQCYRDVYGSD
ncbi:hypothetical protein D6D00_07968 [Aureobasidium pullulans]|nr:hypothetical protein D6D00_07968 [Aureobasidium pullulans]